MVLCENCEEREASRETDDMVWLCEECFQVCTEDEESLLSQAEEP